MHASCDCYAIPSRACFSLIILLKPSDASSNCYAIQSRAVIPTTPQCCILRLLRNPKPQCFSLIILLKPSDASSNCYAIRSRASARYKNKNEHSVFQVNLTLSARSYFCITWFKQDTGIEPASSAWEANILPMY